MENNRLKIIKKIFILDNDLDWIEKELNKFDWDYEWETII